MTSGSTQPASPYDRGTSPVPPPSAHQVVVKAPLRTILGQTILGVLLLLLGFGAVAVAIFQPPPEGGGTALVVGGVFCLIGLLVCLALKRTMSPRTYTFTEAGLDGTDAAGRRFWLPWTALESIVVETWERLGFWDSLFHLRFYLSRLAYFRFVLLPGAEFSGVPAAWAKGKGAWLSFPNRPELVHSFAYGCRAFAGPKFQGVRVR